MNEICPQNTVLVYLFILKHRVFLFKITALCQARPPPSPTHTLEFVNYFKDFISLFQSKYLVISSLLGAYFHFRINFEVTIQVIFKLPPNMESGKIQDGHRISGMTKAKNMVF